MHKDPHAAYVPHTRVGADTESGRTDYGFILCCGYKIVVVGAQAFNESPAVCDPAGGQPQRVFHYTGHPSQGGDPLRVLRPDGADDILHKAHLPTMVFGIIPLRR